VRGGPRTRSGPASDPNALRRRSASEWTLLPFEGRAGSPPPWPLVKPTDRERDLWRKLWALPQAAMWEQQHQELEVALYVRRLTEAEQPGSRIGLGTLVRQIADSLGLTTPGMRANRWRIEEAPKPVQPAIPLRRSARDRMQAGDPG
jgi:hypothetical protein